MKNWVRITGTQYHKMHDATHTECGRRYQPAQDIKAQVDVPFSRRCRNCLKTLQNQITITVEENE